MSPTFSVSARAAREYAHLNGQNRTRFTVARRAFVEALRTDPSALPPSLRVKRVQGHAGIWELTWAADGRATFEYGDEQSPGEPHVCWRRIGKPFDLLRPVDTGYLQDAGHTSGTLQAWRMTLTAVSSWKI